MKNSHTLTTGQSVKESTNQMYENLYDPSVNETRDNKTQEKWYQLGYEDGVEIGKEEMMLRIANRLIETLDDETLAEKLGVNLNLISHIREGNFEIFKNYEL